MTKGLILATVLVVGGCASTGGRAAGGVAVLSGGVAVGALVSSICLAPSANDDCNRDASHQVMLGSVLVGIAALAVMVGFEMNHIASQNAQANVQP